LLLDGGVDACAIAQLSAELSLVGGWVGDLMNGCLGGLVAGHMSTCMHEKVARWMKWSSDGTNVIVNLRIGGCDVLDGSLAGWLVGWLVGWLADRLAGWLAGWLEDV